MTATRADTPTLPQLILRQAAGLREPFHESDLILSCWRAHPREFGLRGHEHQFPDANRVRCVVQGAKGLARRGWMAKREAYHWALTVPGRAEARRLAEGKGGRRALLRDWIPPDLDEELVRLYNSSAYTRRNCGREVRPWDALAFWGCDAEDGPGTIRDGMDLVEMYLTDAEDYLTVPLSIGVVLDVEMVKRIRDLHEWCRREFSKRLGLEG